MSLIPCIPRKDMNIASAAIRILLVCLACSTAARHEVHAQNPTQSAGAASSDTIRVCVVEKGVLRDIVATTTASGDTVASEQQMAAALSLGPEYAAVAPWYVNNDPILFQSRRLVKYGLPRVLGINEVTRVGDFNGVPLFAEVGETRPEVVYVPVRPGCEFQPYQDEAYREPAGAAPGLPFHTVRVYYGTNRQRSGDPRPSRYYSGARGRLEYGSVNVSIPLRHAAGGMESGILWEDPKKHIALLRVAPMTHADMIQALRRDLAQKPEKSLLVFIHGFNVTFRDAARRTAQISHDVQFRGVPLMFSWPSDGTPRLSAYVSDQNDADWAVQDLKTFIQNAVRQSGATKVHVIAHSMGNRVLAGAMRELNRLPNPPRFNHLVLTAPDLDASVFARDIAPVFRQHAERVTLYASDNDRALQVSKRVNQNVRAGQGGQLLTIVPGIDVVDASYLDTSILGLGHSYFAETTRVISDLFAIIRHDQPPAQRQLQERRKGQLTYWILPR